MNKLTKEEKMFLVSILSQLSWATQDADKAVVAKQIMLKLTEQIKLNKKENGS